MKLSLVLIVLTAASWAEAVLSTGVDGQISLPGIVPAAVEPWIRAGGDFILPLSDKASLLLDADGRVGYALPDGFMNWFSAGEAALSRRGDRWFWKIGGRVEGDGEAMTGAAGLAVIALAAASVDFNAFTLSFSPTVRWSTDAGLPFGFTGELGAVLPAGEEVVLRTACKGGLEGPGLAEWFLEGSAGFTWYSPALIVLSADGGYRRRVSPLPESASIDGTTVVIPSADDSHEAFLAPEVSFAPGRDILVTARAPAWFRLWNHGQVGDGTLIPSVEWALGFSPAGFIRMDFSELFALKVSAGADLVLTNSAYREGSSVYLSVEGILTLGGR